MPAVAAVAVAAVAVAAVAPAAPAAAPAAAIVSAVMCASGCSAVSPAERQPCKATSAAAQQAAHRTWSPGLEVPHCLITTPMVLTVRDTTSSFVSSGDQPASCALAGKLPALVGR